jgi:hypothetical protein
MAIVLALHTAFVSAILAAALPDLIQTDEVSGYVHLPRGTEAERIKQLVAEQLVTVAASAGLNDKNCASE